MGYRLEIVVVMALFAALAPGPVPAHAAPVPPGATWTRQWFPSEDGTMLDADVFLPSNRMRSDKHPVILSVGPYFGSGGWIPPSPARVGPVSTRP